MSTKESREPLLYIMQPAIKFPKASMQETFVLTKPPVDQKPLLNDEAKEKFDSQKEEQLLVETNEVNLEEEKVNVGTEIQSPNKRDLKKLETEDVQEIIQQYHQDQSAQEENPSPSQPKRSQKSISFKPVKSFKEMGIQEKLNYLEHFPKQLPPVPCIFITKNSSIKGFLVLSGDDLIEIKQFNNKKVELSFKDLIDIKMLGLK